MNNHLVYGICYTNGRCNIKLRFSRWKWNLIKMPPEAGDVTHTKSGYIIFEAVLDSKSTLHDKVMERIRYASTLTPPTTDNNTLL